MKRENFHKRLRAVMRVADLTAADVAHFFDRSYPTVRQWIVNSAREPFGPSGREAYRCLEVLEKLVERKDGPLPVSSCLSHSTRKRHMQELRDRYVERDNSVSSSRSPA
jgi:hypothetical protein